MCICLRRSKAKCPKDYHRGTKEAQRKMTTNHMKEVAFEINLQGEAGFPIQTKAEVGEDRAQLGNDGLSRGLGPLLMLSSPHLQSILMNTGEQRE